MAIQTYYDLDEAEKLAQVKINERSKYNKLKVANTKKIPSSYFENQVATSDLSDSTPARDSKDSTITEIEVPRSKAKSTFDLTKDQQSVYDDAMSWVKANCPRRYRVYSGWAGTGKSTVLKLIAEELESKFKLVVQTLSFTNKTVSTLKGKGFKRVSTIHKYIYRPLIKHIGATPILTFQKVFGIEADILLVDEYSLVSPDVLRDLKSFRKPIIFIGDGFQPSAMSGSNNLLSETSIYLDEITRQAALNPIIKYATMVRQGLELPKGIIEQTEFGSFRTENATLSINKSYQVEKILCSTNRRRIFINNQIRQQLGYVGLDYIFPQVGEALIGLKNTNDVMNGQEFQVVKKLREVNEGIYYRLQAVVEGNSIDTLIHKAKFQTPLVEIESLFKTSNPANTFFDYSYCITGHKSQGAEFKSVLIYDDAKWLKEEYRKWLYMCITRATDDCTVVQP